MLKDIVEERQEKSKKEINVLKYALDIYKENKKINFGSVDAKYQRL